MEKAEPFLLKHNRLYLNKNGPAFCTFYLPTHELLLQNLVARQAQDAANRQRGHRQEEPTSSQAWRKTFDGVVVVGAINDEPDKESRKQAEVFGRFVKEAFLRDGDER